MVNRVLLTYNPSKAIDEVVAAGDRSNLLLYFGVRDLVNINQIFLDALHREGVAVEEANHDAGLEGIASQVATAEFVWHDFNLLYRQLGTEFGVDRKSPERKVQAICEIIRDKGKLPYSHGIRDFLSSMNKVQSAEYLAQQGVPVPKIQSVRNYLDGEKPLPVVLKVNEGSRGENIFFVEKLEQLVNYFDREFYRKGIRVSLGDSLEMHETTLPDPEEYHVSEFIDSPSDHYTHFRILTFRDQILGAVLNYSSNKKSDESRMSEKYGRGTPGRMPNWTTAPESPMYLTQIPVTITPNSREINDYERTVLEKHGINPNNPELPINLVGLAKRVGTLLSEHGSAYLGQDWIMDRKGNFYCLEVNDAPGMDAFNMTHNHGSSVEAEGMRVGYQVLARAIRNFQPE
jgi:hypothetical protein